MTGSWAVPPVGNRRGQRGCMWHSSSPNCRITSRIAWNSPQAVMSSSNMGASAALTPADEVYSEMTLTISVSLISDLHGDQRKISNNAERSGLRRAGHTPHVHPECVVYVPSHGSARACPLLFSAARTRPLLPRTLSMPVQVSRCKAARWITEKKRTSQQLAEALGLRRIVRKRGVIGLQQRLCCRAAGLVRPRAHGGRKRKSSPPETSE